MKIFYLLHTDWNWIKQRSQFLAENLNSNDVDVTVIYKFSLKRLALVDNKTPLTLIPVLFSPFYLLSFKAIEAFDRIFFSCVLRVIFKLHDVDIVIVTHPILYRYLSKTKVKVVYDCHDDNANFYPDSKLRKLVEAWHEVALRASDLTVFSSRNLSDKWSACCKLSQVVRNGHQIVRTQSPRLRDVPEDKDREFNLVYFGTVSEWFDNELITRLVEEFSNLRVTIIGPVDGSVINHHSVKYVGALPHSEMMSVSATADAFIMPFVVNPLIRSVDPVKLYEYLSFNVPVISVWYDELHHFGHLVRFYESSDDAVQLIEQAMASPFVSGEEISSRDDFLASSTWGCRADEVRTCIQKITK